VQEIDANNFATLTGCGPEGIVSAIRLTAIDVAAQYPITVDIASFEV